MFYVSEIQTEAPGHFQTQLQKNVYEALEKEMEQFGES